jgi:replicative DNA helicase
MGKTSLAMQIAQNVALDHREAGREITGKPVLIFSIETGAKRLMFRAICSRSKANIQDLRRGFVSEDKLAEVRKHAAELATAPIYIDESGSLKIFEFKARCRQAVSRFGVGLIIIDYLQLMKSPSKRAEFSKTLEITEVSVAIKEMARSLNVPVIALAQLNREVENRHKARPRMSDLRESGQLEQDADLILLLHRDDYYLPEGSEERAEAEGKATLIVAKQKDGPTAEITLGFEKEFARFFNLTTKIYSNNETERQQKF